MPALLAGLVVAGVLPAAMPSAAQPRFATSIVGDPVDVVTTPLGDVALTGRGSDFDAAFRSLGVGAAGGDVVVLGAPGGDGDSRYLRRVAGVDAPRRSSCRSASPLLAASGSVGLSNSLCYTGARPAPMTGSGAWRGVRSSQEAA